MIDTIRFRLPLEPQLYELFKKKSIQWSKKNNFTGETIFTTYKTNVDLGSYDRSINLFLTDSEPDSARLELSIPKFEYGHNVKLIYFDRFYKILDLLHSNIQNLFGYCPPVDKWEILRLDICYAWKFQNNLVADSVLQIIKSYDYPRKHKTTYDTSIMLKGSWYSIKWYLKHPEYYVHDFKALLKKDPDYAYQVESMSQGVLRFEITLRKKALQHYLEKRRIFASDLNYDIILQLLQTFFSKFFKGAKPEFMSTQEVCNRLILTFGQSKAKDIYAYYLVLTSGNKEAMNNYMRLTSKRNIYRYNQYLRQAKIGIKSFNTNFDIDFSIPSNYVVNPLPATPVGDAV